MPVRYLSLAREANRLTVNFRFQEGSAGLDNKALRDVQRVGDYLRQAGKLQRKAVLVGFGDPKETRGAPPCSRACGPWRYAANWRARAWRSRK
jgi:phosphate transport system substrate-binding protein